MSISKRICAIFVLLFLFLPTSFATLFQTSVVGTDYDFITDADPSTYICNEYNGIQSFEMPDKRYDDAELFQQAYVFTAFYSDGAEIDIAVSEKIGAKSDAEKEIQKYVGRLGKLPSVLRWWVSRVVVHVWDATAFADIWVMVLYSENADKRISTHDLEETIFHESIHASLDSTYANSAWWLDAQRKDGGFVTAYGENKPTWEDLAESAIFAYTIGHNPERIPKGDREKIEQAIPHRIEFIESIIPKNQSIFSRTDIKKTCVSDVMKPISSINSGVDEDENTVPDSDKDIRSEETDIDQDNKTLKSSETHPPYWEIKTFIQSKVRSIDVSKIDIGVLESKISEVRLTIEQKNYSDNKTQYLMTFLDILLDVVVEEKIKIEME